MSEVTWVTNLLTVAFQGEPLLDTKMRVPRAAGGIVTRPRLLQRLDGVLESRLTIVSAPPGFGKTTLVCDWLSTRTTAPVAWVSLDEEDNDPARFWAYFVAALEQVCPDIRGHAATAFSQSGSGVPVESLIAALINVMSSAGQESILVIDDYHVISSPNIHKGIMYLLNHVPQDMHIVMTCRAEPPFSLARLRARGQLLEIRPEELRFTIDETVEFLTLNTGLDLGRKHAERLDTHVEGWAAALRLAGLSLREGRDFDSLIDGITGQHHFIADYLAEEVFRQQTKDLQSFLLRTSILDRMNAGLCDAVTASEGSSLMLDVIERSNLFLECLDERREWHKYHPLFAEFLRSRLERDNPDAMPTLYSRAALWLKEHGLTRDAISYALKAHDYRGAATTAEPAARGLFMRAEISTVLRWTEPLPLQIVLEHTDLCLVRVWCLMSVNRNDQAQALLSEFKKKTGMGDDYSPGAVQALALNGVNAEVIAEVASQEAAILLVRGDVKRVISICRQVLSWLRGRGSFLHGVLNRALGMALGITGDTNGAARTLAEAHYISQETGNTLVEMTALESLAQLYTMQGEISRASAIYRQIIRSSEEGFIPTLPVTGFAYIRLGRLLYHLDDLDGAQRYVLTGIERCGQFGSLDTSALGHITMGRIDLAQGDVQAAWRELRTAEALARGYDTVRTSSWIQVERARLCLAEGNAPAAGVWADGIERGAEMTEPRESEYIMAARVRLHQSRPAGALEFLEPVEADARAGRRVVRLIEGLCLKALAQNALGQVEEAFCSLGEALSLTSRERFMRLFLDEGAPMAALLAGYLEHARAAGVFADTPAFSRDTVAHAEALLGRAARGSHGAGGVEQRPPAEVAGVPAPGTGAPVPRQGPPVLGVLSGREREILSLVCEGLSNKEIASRLVISVTTVKWHVKNIFGKLDVRTRTQATIKVREAGLV